MWPHENLSVLELNKRNAAIWHHLPTDDKREWAAVIEHMLLGKRWEFNMRWEQEPHRTKKKPRLHADRLEVS